MAKELRLEDEDGTNMIHILFDQAAEKAVINGSKYVVSENMNDDTLEYDAKGYYDEDEGASTETEESSEEI
jgi:hypothetical protein